MQLLVHALHQWKVLSICRIIILLNDVLAFAILMVLVNQNTDVHYVNLVCHNLYSVLYLCSNFKNNEQYIVSASPGTSHLVCLGILVVILPCFVWCSNPVLPITTANRAWVYINIIVKYTLCCGVVLLPLSEFSGI